MNFVSSVLWPVGSYIESQQSLQTTNQTFSIFPGAALLLHHLSVIGKGDCVMALSWLSLCACTQFLSVWICQRKKRDISHCAAEFVHHNWDQCKNLEGEKKRTVRRRLIKMSPWKLWQVGWGLIPLVRLRLGGEAWGSTVRCLRRIRCNVGDEISSDRWSIYPCESNWYGNCLHFEFNHNSTANHWKATASWNYCEIKAMNKLGMMCLIYSGV